MIRAGAVNKGIVGHVNMSRFVNRGLNMSCRVIRTGAVNEGIVGRVNMSRFVNRGSNVSCRVIRAEAVNRGVELIVVRCVIKSCRGAKKCVVVVSVGRSMMW